MKLEIKKSSFLLATVLWISFGLLGYADEVALEDDQLAVLIQSKIKYTVELELSSNVTCSTVGTPLKLSVPAAKSNFRTIPRSEVLTVKDLIDISKIAVASVEGENVEFISKDEYIYEGLTTLVTIHVLKDLEVLGSFTVAVTFDGKNLKVKINSQDSVLKPEIISA